MNIADGFFAEPNCVADTGQQSGHQYNIRRLHGDIRTRADGYAEQRGRFTSAVSAPAAAFVAFSTRAEQTAQIMPVTRNFRFTAISLYFYYLSKQSKMQ